MSAETRDIQQEAISFSYILHVMAVSGDDSKIDSMSISDLADFDDYVSGVKFNLKAALYDRLLLAGHVNLGHYSIEKMLIHIHRTWDIAHDEDSEWLILLDSRSISLTRFMSNQFRTTYGGGFVVAYLRDGVAVVLSSEKRSKGKL